MNSLLISTRKINELIFYLKLYKFNNPINMYYRTINGIKYDNKLLIMAEEYQSQLLTDDQAWFLIEACSDGSNFTKIELETLNYISEQYDFSVNMTDKLKLILFMCYSLVN